MSTPPRTTNVRELSFNERKAYALSVAQDGRHHQMGPWTAGYPLMVAKGVRSKCMKCGCGVLVFEAESDRDQVVIGTALIQDCRG